MPRLPEGGGALANSLAQTVERRPVECANTLPAAPFSQCYYRRGWVSEQLSSLDVGRLLFFYASWTSRDAALVSAFNVAA